jgi:hypothetical protein
MRLPFLLVALALAAMQAVAAGHEGAVLEYRMKVRLRDQGAWTETGFRVVTTPALVTRNKVKKPRLGGWRIEPIAVQGVLPSSTLLARAKGLLYFAGPTPEVLARDSGMTLGNRRCRLWQAQTPQGVAAYVYLLELAPNLLALSYLSASLGDGEIASMELHLVAASLGPRTSPAEEGTALVRTLQRWGAAAGSASAGAEVVESEDIR